MACKYDFLCANQIAVKLSNKTRFHINFNKITKLQEEKFEESVLAFAETERLQVANCFTKNAKGLFNKTFN